MVSRRAFLRSFTACSGAVLTPAAHLWASPQAAEPLTLRAGAILATIPENFLGLGYEMSSAARLGLLSQANKPYLELVRALGSQGVLRLGGIVADYTTYSPSGQILTEPKNTVITRASLEQLRGFLDATGWTALWSVNFGRGTLDQAIAEATDVARILGPKLLAIELGNEVENYGTGTEPRRPAPYTYENYRAEYTRWRSALLAAVPTLRFAAPDTATSVEWVERMAADAHGDVQLLTTHYYRGNQRTGTQDQLLHPDPALNANLLRLRQASQQSAIPWRMCETNSFFGGGRPGLSNTLTGALWTLDYALRLAQAGCAGINLETGVNHLGFVSSYSPIQDDNAGHNSAGIPYYGLLAFAQARQSAPQMMAATVDAAPDTFSAYLLGNGRHIRSVVLINRSLDQPVTMALHPLRLGNATVLRLAGPSSDSQTGVTLAGATVRPDGTWSPATREPITGLITLPPASAAVIRT